jgi:hypothetical protein
MSENLKLSEASKQCGINVHTLKLLIADDLLPQAIRTAQGSPLLPGDSLPTWQECRRLVEQRRDHHLQRAAKLLGRVQVELEAIGNDIAEAREHPTEPLGVDLSSSSSWSQSGQNALAMALHQFEYARLEVERYQTALMEIVESDRA